MYEWQTKPQEHPNSQDLQVTHEPDWHGYRLRNGIGLYVGPFEGKTRIAIYQIKEDGSKEALCFFNNETKARQFLWWLDALSQLYLQRDWQKPAERLENAQENTSGPLGDRHNGVLQPQRDRT